VADDAEIGKVGWIDITVDDATGLRDFYSAVTGWNPKDVSMVEYSDFMLTMPENDEPAAGICHARGATQNCRRNV
jgi:predicted enzyme related to lactoylglutathione lyase